MTPAEAVARDCAELATLAPLLTPALRRDQTGGGRYGRLEHLSLFNTDVHLARTRILAEVPAAVPCQATRRDGDFTWRCHLTTHPGPHHDLAYGVFLT